MITNVGLYHEVKRKRPWLVAWWEVPDPETGRQKKRTKTFQYKRDAQAFRCEKQEEINDGSLASENREVALKRLLDEFREARLAKLSHSSKMCYENTINQLLTYFGGEIIISAIQQRNAESFMSSRRRLDGRPGELSTWSLAQHLKHSRAILGAAVDWGYLTRNPFKPSASRGQTSLHVRGKSRSWHHLTMDEFNRLVDATPSVRRRAMNWFMYGCGLRPGEVANLTVDRIDLTKRVVHVENREATADIPPFTLKSENQSDQTKARTIPIPSAAMPDITEAMRGAMKSGGFISLTADRFQIVQDNWQKCRAELPRGTSQKPRPWQNKDLLNNALRDAKSDLRRAGIELSAPFTLTTFRKSFAQNHADAGTPPKTLAGLLGHSDVRITLRFYNRVTDANKRAAGETIDRLFAAHFHCVSTGADSEGVA